MKNQGLLLFAHGSRDPDWARPFEELARLVASKQPEQPVRVAYLDLMKPTFEEAASAFAGAGVRRLRVIPLFMGAGGHVSRDLPRLAEAAQHAHPQMTIEIDPALGDQPRVLEAIASALVDR